MTINIKLLTTEPLNKNGYSLIFILSHKGKRKKYKICNCLPEHWIASEELLSSRHPDYDILAPKIQVWKAKAKKILLSRPDDINEVYENLFNEKKAVDLGTFNDMGMAVVSELEASANSYEKRKDYINANKARGNARVYERALIEFDVFAPGIKFSGITFKLLMQFRDARLQKGNSKSTVSLYLRTLRALYNKFIKIHEFEASNPFEGVMKGLTVKSYAARKKNMSAEMIKKIEVIEHDYPTLYRFTDFWLLQYYFAGADYMDIYYLKNEQLRNGRVYFNRNKGNSGVAIDLKVHPKAQTIIDKYKQDGEYVFPWRKDVDGYKTHRRKAYDALKKAQIKHGIELSGAGGIWGHKVARHTFASIAKTMGIDEDLLRELQGHERDEIDNYYKDRYPEAMRDEALYRVIA
ncbi:MAG: hypothetical protein BM557_09665 [Flavobacterium sp. MedPE-SWcel]|uniref:tyrosine-type recombinase/integrase n=1 Tax=uncultured Flavobacterium sp. TaxID=165435 RepID=UPI00091A178A|nr:phage integrase SAM-like domain-containing protein [uncultured Flavobacterium sp.]OIQ16571.1 MAG: hypothetical protein BM557_09665 [Flavobacterium sp. MedPE-SWcel]